jgi:hypothetical protein
MGDTVGAGRVVFAVHDGTTYRNLQPIAAALPESFEVEYLLLDDLFDEDGVPAGELRPHRRASEYVRDELFVRLNRRTRPGRLSLEGIQWLLDDVFTPRIAYHLDDYLADAKPDLFVCGHDRLPFVKHVIQRCNTQDIPTAVVQHGIQRMEYRPADSWVVEALRPTRSPRVQSLEKAKRRILYQHGAYIFCNPHVDTVFTIGDFFSDQIRRARSEYPCLGRGTVTTTGYPEYSLTEMGDYNPEIETALFLSGWEYELGEWGNSTEQQIVDLLRGVERANDIDVRVRPHPKDSAEKIDRFYSDFRISDVDDLETDIERHDFICTVYSTALLLAAAMGKVCGVLRIPWERNRFGPFDDEHVLAIDSDTNEIRRRASDRSTETQAEFLRQFSYIPSIHAGTEKTPAGYIASELLEMVTTE